MKLKIPFLTPHYNQILYSTLMYCEHNNTNITIIQDDTLPENGCVLEFNGCKVFLDYSDDSKFLSNNLDSDFYFKRSLNFNDKIGNIYPLNFQIDFTYKPLALLKKLPRSILFDRRSKVEVIRALDYFSLVTNDSHQSKNLDNFLIPRNRNTKSGKVIFMTRLWDPARNSDPLEKARRIAQNNFRINACRIIKKEFPDSIVGLYPDYYAKDIAKDVLLDFQQTKKSNYLKFLGECDIAIADDGLKDTPGWKIGEYIMSHKAIISTPINIFKENFHEGKNYLSTKSRDNFKILPELINQLIQNENYKIFQNENKKWYQENMEPIKYLEKILVKCN